MKVAVVFEPGCQVKPVWFEWQREKRNVRNINYFWKDQVGHATRLHFAVSDGCDTFELVYDVLTQGWSIEGVES